MGKRGPARIEAPCASKDASGNRFQIDEANGCCCEAKGHHTRSVARPPRPQMDKRGFARIKKPFTSKDTGDHNFQVDEKNGYSCEETGRQTRSVRQPSPVNMQSPSP